MLSKNQSRWNTSLALPCKGRPWRSSFHRPRRSCCPWSTGIGLINWFRLWFKAYLHGWHVVERHNQDPTLLRVVRLRTWAARWLVFKPKIPIWVNFRGSCNRRCWSTLWSFGIFRGLLVIFPVLVSCSKKNQATLRRTATYYNNVQSCNPQKNDVSFRV
jgi:hypothetical protein